MAELQTKTLQLLESNNNDSMMSKLTAKIFFFANAETKNEADQILKAYLQYLAERTPFLPQQ